MLRTFYEFDKIERDRSHEQFNTAHALQSSARYKHVGTSSHSIKNNTLYKLESLL
jgi:hypothetical protein